MGFSFNLTPNYKLRHGGTYTVTARLYNGSELNNSTDSGIVVDNPTVRSGVYSPYIASKNVNLSDGGADYITDLVSIVNSSKNNYLYRNYVYHYAYDALKIALPLPANATPGYYAGADFVTMAPEDTRELSDGTTITYHENYAYVNAGGTTLGSGKALVYTLPAESPYAAGTTSVSILYLDSDVLGHMYLSFPGSTAAGTYSAAYSLQVSAAIDGTDTVLYDYQTYYLLSFIFKEYNPGDYFNHTLTYTSDVYNTGNYLVNMENAASFLDQFNNTTGETMEDITVEYTVPADMYLNKVRCGLSASTSSPLPSTATVVYRLNGESTDYTKVLTADEISFSLTNPSDAITHMEVTFDKLGTCTYQNLLFGSIVNRGNRETGTGSVYSRIISSHGSDTIGEYAESASRSYTFYYRTSYDSLYPYLLASTSALNKGDTFNIRFAGASSAAQLTNPRFYILMPSEFIFVSYTPASNCADSPYELTTKSVTVTPAQAGANMPAGGYTLYTIKYEGDYLASTGYYHYMYFKVGPTVDTASVRTLNLPAVYAATSDNALFKYRADTASYRFTDVWDFDEDGDTAEVLAKPSSLPLITINAVSTLTAQAFLTSSSANGESVSQSFQYNATGSYKLYLYNGYGTGESASGCAFDISIPRDGTGVTYNGITYTSSWNAILTGPPQLSGGFLAGADVLYSTDGGESYSSDTPEDYGAVTNLRIATAPDLTLGSRESIVITLPIEADYEDDVTASSKAYFGAGLSFKLSSSGDEVYATAIEPCAMQTQTVSITGSVFKDYNGNGVQDATEQANNKSYSVSLYKISGSTQTLISTYTTNVSTGAYTAGILLPGDYKLKVAIGAGEYYPVVTAESLFNENGEYFFTAGGPEPPQLTGVNLGVVSPRTLSVNFSSVTLIEGTPRKIVVTAYPALFGDEAVTFLSSDETVVTVAADGTLTYAGDGTAQITVTVPQLSGYVAAVPGADPTLTTTVNVTCQRPGCHVTADPYITKTPGIATAITSDMVLYSPTSQYTGYYYYYFNRGGYCNDPAHTQTTSVTWEIVSAGTTGAAIYTSSSGSGSLYGHIRLSYTPPTPRTPYC